MGNGLYFDTKDFLSAFVADIFSIVGSCDDVLPGSKEKDAMELQVKRSKAFKEKQKRMKELAKEIEEMKEMINEKVKDPAIIRRNSIQAFSDLAII